MIKAGSGQQKEHPEVFCAVSWLRISVPVAKRLLMKPTHQPGQDCEKQPFDQIGHVIPDVPGIIVQVVEFLPDFFYPVCCS